MKKRISALQIGTKPQGTQATLEAILSFESAIKEAQTNLVVMPEALLGGYPKGEIFGTRLGYRLPEGRESFKQYFDEAITVPDRKPVNWQIWRRALIRIWSLALSKSRVRRFTAPPCISRRKMAWQQSTANSCPPALNDLSGARETAPPCPPSIPQPDGYPVLSAGKITCPFGKKVFFNNNRIYSF